MAGKRSGRPLALKRRRLQTKRITRSHNSSRWRQKRAGGFLLWRPSHSLRWPTNMLLHWTKKKNNISNAAKTAMVTPKIVHSGSQLQGSKEATFTIWKDWWGTIKWLWTHAQSTQRHHDQAHTPKCVLLCWASKSFTRPSYVSWWQHHGYAWRRQPKSELLENCFSTGIVCDSIFHHPGQRPKTMVNSLDILFVLFFSTIISGYCLRAEI